MPARPTVPNLAVGATVVEVSSVFSDAWAAANAIDGDLSTEWATAADGDCGYLVVDLGRRQAITGVAFLTRSMADGFATAQRYSVTADGGARFGPFPVGMAHDERFAAVEMTARRIRFDIESSTGGNTGAVEIRVYGANR